MNRSQMKSAIAKFKSADVSIIKDDAMRAKAQKLQAKQKGFTLLELLVVITLLATLATAALVAYDGAGEKAQASTAANTMGTLDRGVRGYKAVTGEYPNQWDNLSNPVAAGTPGGAGFINADLQDVLGSMNLFTSFTTAGFAAADIGEYFEEDLGIEEVQHLFGTGVGINGAVLPNRAHNEGANGPDGSGNGAVETEFADFAATGDLATGVPAFVSILATDAYEAGTTTAMGCTVGGIDITTNWAGVPATPESINAINDALSTERCSLVLALGFGGDAAHSTINSAASITQSPTYSSAEVNPAETYGRYVALFLLAQGEKSPASYAAATGDGISDLTSDEFLARPRLLGFIDTEGNTLDVNIAEATAD